MPDEFNAVPPLDSTTLLQIVEKKATCPFVGSAVATRCLPARYRADNPLAKIEEVRALGNKGGGDLGDVLVLFASGNHAFMLGPNGQLDQEAPEGLFSLEFPGSKGSHPGHSGILQGDPRLLGSGRFSESDFQRLASRAKDGFVARSDVGKFIAENLRRDQNSKVFGPAVFGAQVRDLSHFVESAGPDLLAVVRRADEAAAHRDLEQRLTKFAGEDNLVGSCGEFGLLFAFLKNRPGAKEIAGEPALLLEDLRLMFVEKRLPDGWDSWKKTRIDWLINSAALMISAGKAYLAHNEAQRAAT